MTQSTSFFEFQMLININVAKETNNPTLKLTYLVRQIQMIQKSLWITVCYTYVYVTLIFVFKTAL